VPHDYAHVYARFYTVFLRSCLVSVEDHGNTKPMNAWRTDIETWSGAARGKMRFLSSDKVSEKRWFRA